MSKRSKERVLNVRFRSLFALTIGLAVYLIGVTMPPAAGEGLIDTLRPWIAKNIHMANDRDGRPQLFVRAQNVIADIRFEDSNIALEARTAIAAFADAFRLRHEFARANANLFVVSSRQIAEGKKPNSSLLRELGLPNSAIDIMTRTENWESGCGVYDFGDRNGRISVSIVAADTRLDPDLMQACVFTGIVFSFGLRMQTKARIAADDGYYHYLALARALRFCLDGPGTDRNEPSASLERIAGCAAKFMTDQVRQ